MIDGATSMVDPLPERVEVQGDAHRPVDTSTDLAVLQVDAPASALEPIPLGDSTVLQVGDEVVAIGSPFGLEETVTSGIVSALHREITAPNQATITDAIQTDAPINSGNSGGPLLNMAAQVVGVNAQIESSSGGNNGVGFAVPSETIRQIVPQLLAQREGRARVPRRPGRDDPDRCGRGSEERTGSGAIGERPGRDARRQGAPQGGDRQEDPRRAARPIRAAVT